MLHSYETPEFWWVTKSLTPIVVKLLNLIYNTLTFHYVLQWEFIRLVLTNFRRDTMDLRVNFVFVTWFAELLSSEGHQGLQSLEYRTVALNDDMRTLCWGDTKTNHLIAITSCLPTSGSTYTSQLCVSSKLNLTILKEINWLCCRLARYLNSFGPLHDNISLHGYGPLLTSLDDCFGFICPLRSII